MDTTLDQLIINDAKNGAHLQALENAMIKHIHLLFAKNEAKDFLNDYYDDKKHKTLAELDGLEKFVHYRTHLGLQRQEFLMQIEIDKQNF